MISIIRERQPVANNKINQKWAISTTI
jgi:hypothetical protein